MKFLSLGSRARETHCRRIGSANVSPLSHATCGVHFRNRGVQLKKRKRGWGAPAHTGPLKNLCEALQFHAVISPSFAPLVALLHTRERWSERTHSDVYFCFARALLNEEIIIFVAGGRAARWPPQVDDTLTKTKRRLAPIIDELTRDENRARSFIHESVS